ncbi:MAG: hypothetical protein SWK76_09345 [Actinomycetota bacterium]|nr:hypothetical protein [Actinomycetota bacterium]
MDQQRFTIGDAVRYGWDTMKNNFAYFVVIVIISWFAEGVPSSLQAILGKNNGGLNALFGIIGFVVSLFVGMAFIKIGLRFTAGEKADFDDLWSAYPALFRYLLGVILYALIIIGGLILLIVPGIIWGVKYQFFGFFIIDEGREPTNALTRSGQITKGVKGYLFLFNLAQLGIFILGILACVVGLLAAIPVNLVAQAYIYRRLLATEARGQAEPVQPTPQAGEPAQQNPPAQPPTN